MTMDNVRDTFGFRYSSSDRLALCNLYAIGRDIVRDPVYRWDGITRNDGPLLLFQYTIDGEGVLETSGETYRLEPGRALMVEIPGNHAYYFPEHASHWTFLFIQMRPTLIAPNWHEAKRRLGETPFLPQSSKPIRILQDIFDEAHAGRITDSYTASSMVYHFVTELCRFAATPQSDRREWPIKVRQAVEIIESQYGNMISLDQLADQLNLSKHHMIRIFSAVIGISPGVYLNRVRIEQAMRLLRHSNLNIDLIAERVGYSSGSYFIKVFRKLTGCTPGEFRSGHGQMTIHRMLFN